MDKNTKEILTQKEVEDIITNFSDSDWKKLGISAKGLMPEYSYRTSEDLLNEALEKTLEGKRHCPRDLDFLKFVFQTMRSIVHNWRTQNKNQNKFEKEVENSLVPQDSEEIKVHQAQNKERLSEIYDLFKDDDEGTIILEELEKGKSAKEIQEEFGLSITEYNTIRRRLRRKINKKYSNGSKK